MKKFNINDDAWIYLGLGDENPLCKGKVVHVFNLPDWAFEHYVVEIDTEIDPLLMVRSSYNMRTSDD